MKWNERKGTMKTRKRKDKEELMKDNSSLPLSSSSSCTSSSSAVVSSFRRHRRHHHHQRNTNNNNKKKVNNSRSEIPLSTSPVPRRTKWQRWGHSPTPSPTNSRKQNCSSRSGYFTADKNIKRR